MRKTEFSIIFKALMKKHETNPYRMETVWPGGGSRRQMISNWSVGRHQPNWENLVKIQQVLGCDWKDLFESQDEA